MRSPFGAEEVPSRGPRKLADGTAEAGGKMENGMLKMKSRVSVLIKIRLTFVASKMNETAMKTTTQGDLKLKKADFRKGHSCVFFAHSFSLKLCIFRN